ncbi:MAG: hypothetical protein ACPGUV_13885, partial [Polyangiales bacterium]
MSCPPPSPNVRSRHQRSAWQRPSKRCQHRALSLRPAVRGLTLVCIFFFVSLFTAHSTAQVPTWPKRTLGVVWQGQRALLSFSVR